MRLRPCASDLGRKFCCNKGVIGCDRPELAIVIPLYSRSDVYDRPGMETNPGNGQADAARRNFDRRGIVPGAVLSDSWYAVYDSREK